MDEEISLTGGGRTAVSRRGDVVFRAAGTWSRTVVRLLQHFEEVGFHEAPRVVGAGFDERGRETLLFVEGDIIHPHPWADEAMPVIGGMLKRLHDAAALFPIPADATWRPWFGRDIGDGPRVIGHCDTGPWNVISQAGMPKALIDWEVAGPVARDTELAQACWLNAQLYDDDIAERMGLGSARTRANQVRLLLDGYGIAKQERGGFVDKILAFAVHDAADQAIQGNVTPDSQDAEPLWAVTWRTRSASWILRNRHTLENALN